MRERRGFASNITHHLKIKRNWNVVESVYLENVHQYYYKNSIQERKIEECICPERYLVMSSFLQRIINVDNGPSSILFSKFDLYRILNYYFSKFPKSNWINYKINKKIIN